MNEWKICVTALNVSRQSRAKYKIKEILEYTAINKWDKTI